jgi:hypothetical protein
VYDMALTTDNEPDTSFEDIVNDILSQDSVTLSVKSTRVLCEVNTEMKLPLRLGDQSVTIEDETRPWHIHVNLFESKETASNRKQNQW